jgi:hypothetical protein
MSFGGRARARGIILRRGALIAGALVVLALVLLLADQLVPGIIAAVLAAAAVWLFLQARTVR